MGISSFRSATNSTWISVSDRPIRFASIRLFSDFQFSSSFSHLLTGSMDLSDWPRAPSRKHQFETLSMASLGLSNVFYIPLITVATSIKMFFKIFIVREFEL